MRAESWDAPNNFSDRCSNTHRGCFRSHIHTIWISNCCYIFHNKTITPLVYLFIQQQPLQYIFYLLNSLFLHLTTLNPNLINSMNLMRRTPQISDFQEFIIVLVHHSKLWAWLYDSSLKDQNSYNQNRESSTTTMCTRNFL